MRHRNRTKKRFPALDISKLPGPTPKEGEGGEEPEKGEIEEEGVKEIKEEGEKTKEEINVVKEVEVKKEPEKKNVSFLNQEYNSKEMYRIS